MPTYAIGDVQGCYDPLLRLLDKCQFDQNTDTLWFAGDLVNRGPQSLETLRFIKQLGARAISILGNHDLALLAAAYNLRPSKKDPKLQDILQAPDCEELIEWLRLRNIMHYDKTLDFAMVHAGIPPQWDLNTAIARAKELENTLHSPDFLVFLQNMFGDSPSIWSDALQGWDRLRYITNAFTRMRFCSAEGQLELQAKGKADQAPTNLYPWFKIPTRRHRQVQILFGHWAALQGNVEEPNVFALDTGCVWGNCLTAVRLEDKKFFQVSCAERGK